MVMMVVVGIRQNANMDPRHHMVMMVVVVMVANTDGYLRKFFRGARSGRASGLLGFQGCKRVRHGIEQLPITCGMIDRIPLHFGGIRTSDCRDRRGSSQ